MISEVVAKRLKELSDNRLIKSKIKMSLIQHTTGENEEGIPWHQDIDPAIGPSMMYNFIIYLSDTTKETGGIKVVPHTHIYQSLNKGALCVNLAPHHPILR